MVEGNKRLAGHLQCPKGYRFNREELYAEREAAARLNQVAYVLSEDFKADATLEGVTFLNPFAPDFDISGL